MKDFTFLQMCLMNPVTKQNPSAPSSPLFPEVGFDSYEDVRALFASIKWFLMNIYDDDDDDLAQFHQGTPQL